jgi:hypothetical protein
MVALDHFAGRVNDDVRSASAKYQLSLLSLILDLDSCLAYDPLVLGLRPLLDFLLNSLTCR